jgi:hypothetical protein
LKNVEVIILKNGKNCGRRFGLFVIKQLEVANDISCLGGTGWSEFTEVESNDKAKADFSGN